MKEVLIHTINKIESITEVYLNPDQETITEVKYLNYNRIKKYTYSLENFMRSTSSEELNSKISRYINDSTENIPSIRDNTGQAALEVESNIENTDFIKPLGSKVCPI